MFRSDMASFYHLKLANLLKSISQAGEMDIDGPLSGVEIKKFYPFLGGDFLCWHPKLPFVTNIGSGLNIYHKIFARIIKNHTTALSIRKFA